MISNFDSAFFRWFNSLAASPPWLDVLIIFSAIFLGYWVLAALFGFGFATFLPRYRHLTLKNWGMVGTALLAALIARFGVTEVIRFLYDRPRPFEVLTDLRQLVFRDSGGSFPSGHAVFYFALAAVVSRYYPRTSIAFYLAALCISLARVIAGIHWPSDILGGAVVGIAAGLITVSLARKFAKLKTA